MQLLPILVAPVLGALALAFVLYPLYHRTPTSKDEAGQEQALPWTREQIDLATSNGEQSEPALTDREQAARTALQEIELDYQLGNIAEADYRTLRERYMRRALVALKTRYDRDHELDEMIEVQLRKMSEHDGNAEQ